MTILGHVLLVLAILGWLIKPVVARTGPVNRNGGERNLCGYGCWSECKGTGVWLLGKKVTKIGQKQHKRDKRNQKCPKAVKTTKRQNRHH